MKKILVTGKNSYIGNKLKNWLGKYPEKYNIETISLRDDGWKSKSFANYDVVFHAAGMAHVKETRNNNDLYFSVNRDLAYEVAKKAKNEGVGQFIFLSSMSVYGIENGVIDNNTHIEPNTAYGQSKIQAESLINKLQNIGFQVVTLRPPMVYGEGCKGNYPKLSKMAVKFPVFPNIENKRSMIFIDNLSAFIQELIDNQSKGLYFPQNEEYVNVSKMVRLISEVHGKPIILTKLFNPLLRLLKTSTMNKVFGSLIYDKNISNSIDQVSFSETIKRTENK